jgi:hypothetical protein
MKNEIQVDLRIMEFPFHPDQITEMVGVQPTEIWLKGQRTLGSIGALLKENGWGLSSNCDRHAEFGEHIQSLIGQITPYIERFAQVSNQYYTELSCAVYIYYNNDESTPWLGFTKEEMRFFDQIGAAVDFDLYTLPGKKK